MSGELWSDVIVQELWVPCFFSFKVFHPCFSSTCFRFFSFFGKARKMSNGHWMFWHLRFTQNLSPVWHISSWRAQELLPGTQAGVNKTTTGVIRWAIDHLASPVQYEQNCASVQKVHVGVKKWLKVWQNGNSFVQRIELVFAEFIAMLVEAARALECWKEFNDNQKKLRKLFLWTKNFVTNVQQRSVLIHFAAQAILLRSKTLTLAWKMPCGETVLCVCRTVCSCVPPVWMLVAVYSSCSPRISSNPYFKSPFFHVGTPFIRTDCRESCCYKVRCQPASTCQ